MDEKQKIIAQTILVSVYLGDCKFCNDKYCGIYNLQEGKVMNNKYYYINIDDKNKIICAAKYGNYQWKIVADCKGHKKPYCTCGDCWSRTSNDIPMGVWTRSKKIHQCALMLENLDAIYKPTITNAIIKTAIDGSAI